MKTKPKLSDIADHMEMQSDETGPWLNRETGAIYLLHNDVLRAVEDGEDAKEAVEWCGGTEEDIVVAQQIANSDTWIALPSKFDIHDYNIMEDFCYAQQDEALRNRLCGAIRGKGAFGRFRAAVEQAGILDDWYAFKNRTYLRQARDWCESEGVAFEEE